MAYFSKQQLRLTGCFQPSFLFHSLSLVSVIETESGSTDDTKCLVGEKELTDCCICLLGGKLLSAFLTGGLAQVTEVPLNARTHFVGVNITDGKLNCFGFDFILTLF